MAESASIAEELRAQAGAAARARVIVVLGPTAGGKSDLAMELARRYGGELISADSMQVYRGMDIGTAKPTAQERAEIRHHAIDLVDAREEGFTVAKWLAVAEQAITEIQARGRVPIVVGGTNLYIRAFFEGLDEAPAADSEFRAELAAISSEELHARLGASDPTADRSSRGPDADESTFRYATAFCLSSAANCSPHSVDPVSVTSSPSQAQNTSVRLGRVPSCLSRPSDLVSSIIDAVPLEGSTPPKTHAS